MFNLTETEEKVRCAAFVCFVDVRSIEREKNFAKEIRVSWKQPKSVLISTSCQRKKKKWQLLVQFDRNQRKNPMCNSSDQKECTENCGDCCGQTTCKFKICLLLFIWVSDIAFLVTNKEFSPKNTMTDSSPSVQNSVRAICQLWAVFLLVVVWNETLAVAILVMSCTGWAWFVWSWKLPVPVSEAEKTHRACCQKFLLNCARHRQDSVKCLGLTACNVLPANRQMGWFCVVCLCC